MVFGLVWVSRWETEIIGKRVLSFKLDVATYLIYVFIELKDREGSENRIQQLGVLKGLFY